MRDAGNASRIRGRRSPSPWRCSNPDRCNRCSGADRRPTCPTRSALGDPFGQHLARAAALGDAEGEDASLEGVWHTGHRADQRQTVGRIRDRAVDHAANACRAKDRHTRHRVLDIPLQPFQIVGVKLEAEILGHRIIGRDPMGLAVPLVGAEVQAVLVLAQVIGAIDVAQQRHLVAIFLGPCLQLGNFFGQEILVRHGDHRHSAPAVGFEPFADALRIVARRS